MKEFLMLLKYEWRSQIPSSLKKGKTDVVGVLLSALISLSVIAVCIVLIATIAKNYVAIKVNKVSAPYVRARELLNLLYALIITAMSVMCLERMRKTLTNGKDKSMFLRLPLKQENIFLSKLAVLFIRAYAVGFALILPVNFIIATAVETTLSYWLNTVCVCILMPLVPFLVACILIVPYIKIVDFVSRRYILLFVLFSGMLIGAFWLYSQVLDVVQKLLATGSIQFLFNERFINAMQALLDFAYPANAFASIVLGQNLTLSYIIVGAVAIVAMLVVWFVTKKLYYVTMYKTERRPTPKKKTPKYKQNSPVLALLKKEFICVFREPKHVFSYFAIATAMPMMAYSCYSLFETLINSMLGLGDQFSLALLITLLFSVLTNTFCATNVSRDGMTTLTSKAFPLKATRIFLAKVVFCGIVSSLSVILSAVLLVAATSLTIWDGVFCGAIGVAFSLAQIFLATRTDLKHAKLSASTEEVEKQSNKTMSKIIVIGFVLALLAGVSSVVLALLSKGLPLMGGESVEISILYSYLVPAFIGVAYLGFAMWYYRKNMEKNFERLIA